MIPQQTSSPPDAGAAGEIAHLLVSELIQPVAPDITSFVTAMIGPSRPLGVLFYGSALRQPDMDGILDFYIIVEHLSDWPAGGWARTANRLLPPNVEYHERLVDGRMVRAKVAILTLAQFRQMTGRGTLDTTIWARFCQPVRLVWVRDAVAADTILACLIRAVAMAARWAMALGPRRGRPEEFWNALFSNTYGAELRVENNRKRPRAIVQGHEVRYRALLAAAWRADGLSFMVQGDVLVPQVDEAWRRGMLDGWWLRQKMGQPLNIARLAKGTFTFSGGARYIAWKIKRHSGIDLPLSPFAERHPLICLPHLLWSLRQAGFFRRKQARD